jgi:uncharacterized protein (TIGR02996 family)
MSDEEALLAAIAANPHEDTPRLVYADWLDEHDQPIRAEFIRTEVAVKRLAELPTAEQARQIQLFRRRQDLLDHHLADLVGSLAADLGYFDVVFDRGFVAELELDAARLVKHAETIAALKPLPDITVRDVARWVETDTDISGPLHLATTIEMQPERWNEPVALSAEGIAGRFAGHGPWRRLRKLDLDHCGVGDVGLASVVGGPGLDAFPALTDLNLATNDITDTGVRLLVASPLWPRLHKLVLVGNPLGTETPGLLAAAAATSRLAFLDLRHANISAEAHPLLLRNYGGRVALF